MDVEARLKELGFELPEVPKPVAEYVPAKRVGDFIYFSSQRPIRDEKLVCVAQMVADVLPRGAYQLEAPSFSVFRRQA